MWTGRMVINVCVPACAYGQEEHVRYCTSTVPHPGLAQSRWPDAVQASTMDQKFGTLSHSRCPMRPAKVGLRKSQLPPGHLSIMVCGGWSLETSESDRKNFPWKLPMLGHSWG